MVDALVVGGGPAGLMAAEALADAGLAVLLAEGKPTMGRKLLMAGKSGLNLTKDAPSGRFLAAFAPATARARLHPMLAAFGPAEVQAWAGALGQAVFTGSSGRVFPVAMKASPLLRAWLARLAAKGVRFETRWRWLGFDDDGIGALFATPEGRQKVQARATVLALGGASWPRLGSDGTWAGILAKLGVEISPFQPANMGFDVPWSPHMQPHFGAPVKAVRLRCGAAESRGEFVITRAGVEGGAIYGLSAALRAAMGAGQGGATLTLDLLPDTPMPALTEKLNRPRRKASIGSFLRKTVGLRGAKAALFFECSKGPAKGSPAALAALLKALPLPVTAPRPLSEAISTAGGVAFSGLDDGLMLKARPGLFCAGEMLDWEAPTGGYLLTACLATGLWSGQAAARFATR